MVNFFIDRPIFAWVVAIMIMMGGAFSLARLPIAQYPDIAPPEVEVVATYPGASAKTIEESVTQVIEQKMKGLDNLLYMYSSSDSSGRATLRFAFETGTNADIAQVQVQNKLQLAMPLLPQEVQRQGITVIKSTANYLLLMAFVSEDNSMGSVDIADYVASNIQDSLGLLPGIGDTVLFGAQYSMRIWCDPLKMQQYKLNPSDVIVVIQEQNNQVAGGQVGAAPALRGQEINVTVNASSRFNNVEQFENILLRTNEDGSSVFLKDVARVELNSEMFNSTVRYNGAPAVGLGVKLASGANALETADTLKSEMEQLSAFFPPGLKIAYPYDTTPFVKISISSVFKTLGEAIILVFLVMYLFLQNFRATLIPTIAVPVVLLGTFGVLALFGYSINSLTMFGLVLSIGLLVDDAIVVVENVERLMQEEKLSPKEATKKSMGQIIGALAGVAMVIAAVFVPMAFTGGATGVIYRQFSVTIVTSMLLSLLVAIVLTPAMCATILHSEHHVPKGVFWGRFNRWFESSSIRYQHSVRGILATPARYVLLYGLGLGLIGFLFVRLPSGFLPDEDQGIMLMSIQLPPGATFERTDKVLEQVQQYILQEESDAVEYVLTVSGASLSGDAQNAGMVFMRLRDWGLRKDERLNVFAVADRVNKKFSNIPDARIFSFAPPAVVELGSSSGFDFELVDRSSQGHEALMQARDQLLAAASKHPDLRNVRHNGLDDVEQYKLGIDLNKAGSQSLRKAEIDTTISAYWGGAYVNDFVHHGRTKKVYLQADAPFRMQSSDFGKYHVRNSRGEMVPFSSFLSVDSTLGSPRLERFNGLPSVEILGEIAPGKSSGQAMTIMENLTKELPRGFGFEWTGMSYQEKLAGSKALFIYVISMAVVFLCLAALYESWSIPLSVLLVVPTGVIGALAGVFFRGMYNDVYFQIGLLTIIGLSAKNSILIVEFAKDLHERGMDLIEATVTAVKLRLRPIIMTSLAFVFGVLPLMISNGAGSGSQNALGTTVVFGMLTATGLGIFMTPIFFVLVNRLFSRKRQAENTSADHQEERHV